jgi:hypothetical protein
MGVVLDSQTEMARGSLIGELNNIFTGAEQFDDD